MDAYYIYQHIRLDSQTVFYIGKGKNQRAWTKHGRNSYWNNIVKKHGYYVQIIQDNLSESEAYNIEKSLIKKFRQFKQCETNMQEGGEGGGSPNLQTRLRMSKSHKGKPKSKTHCKNISIGKRGHRHHFYKKHLSENQRNKMAISQGGKKFRAFKNGILIGEFINMNEASKILNVFGTHISRCLHGKQKHTGGYEFSYV